MPYDIEQVINKVFSKYRIKSYSKGQILILNGDTTDHVYQLIKGTVKVYDVTYRGEEVILNIFKPPAFFPMSLAINKTLNPYIYEADTDIEVRQIPGDEMVEFVKSNLDVLFDLLSRLYSGVDGLMGRMVRLMAGSAKSRLIYELIIEARRFSTVNTNNGCVLKISEKDLASRAGLSRETVSRELSKLKGSNTLKVSGKEIHITNISSLEVMMGQEI